MSEKLSLDAKSLKALQDLTAAVNSLTDAIGRKDLGSVGDVPVKVGDTTIGKILRIEETEREYSITGSLNDVGQKWIHNNPPEFYDASGIAIDDEWVGQTWWFVEKPV